MILSYFVYTTTPWGIIRGSIIKRELRLIVKMFGKGEGVITGIVPGPTQCSSLAL